MGEQHTPGPWIDGGSLLGAARLITNQNGAQIACVYGVRPKRESAANTRLIAAAPETAAERDRLREVNAELMAALKLLHARYLEVIGNEGPEAMAARAAIAKAEGR